MAELQAHPFFSGIDWEELLRQPAPEFAEPERDSDGSSTGSFDWELQVRPAPGGPVPRQPCRCRPAALRSCHLGLSTHPPTPHPAWPPRLAAQSLAAALPNGPPEGPGPGVDIFQAPE